MGTNGWFGVPYEAVARDRLEGVKRQLRLICADRSVMRHSGSLRSVQAEASAMTEEDDIMFEKAIQ